MLESAPGTAMSYYYPLLLYLGSGGGLLLMAISAVPRLRVLRKPVSATWATALALTWGLSPTAGRWVLSVWSPGRVAGGLLVLDGHPALWWCALLVLTSAAGILWATVFERRDDLPLTGALLVIAVTVVWMGLMSGSLLMLLTIWGLFDVIWFVVRLISGADVERVIWASALNGVASLTLWVASLFLLRSGDTGLWWLMRPSPSVLTLLYVAALIRVGFYPFQVGHTEALRASLPLAFVSVLGPVMGVALLYRLIVLPGAAIAPSWVVGWGCLSVLWSGIKALSMQGRRAALAASYGILIAAITGGVAAQGGDLLTIAIGVWASAFALVIVHRHRHGARFVWTLPTLFGVGVLLGIPPSPVFGLYLSALTLSPGPVWRLVYALGIALVSASLLRGTSLQPGAQHRTAGGQVRAIQFGGPLLIVAAVTAVLLCVGATPTASWTMALWLGAILAGAALARWGNAIRLSWGRGRPWIELFDLTWFYRAAWQGAENALGVLRVTAEVVEGSGSVLWSVLILLLALMVIGSR